MLNYLNTRAGATESEIRTKIAYETLQASVVKLQAVSEEHHESILECEKRSDDLERRLDDLTGRRMEARVKRERPQQRPHEDFEAPPANLMDVMDAYRQEAAKK